MLSPQRWQVIKELLALALEIAPSERTAYLDRVAAGNPTLRDELEQLLAASEGAGATLLEHAAPLDMLAEDRMGGVEPSTGFRVGAYEIVEKIGAGGMGEVYRAMRADDQYRKEVAIKLLRRGPDSFALLKRFQIEGQILAALDHPNIACLFDGGRTDDGTPYLVMEMIEGQPIDGYCDAHRLPIEQRLKLFVQVCWAVHYAHQRSIIHRDIKPGNILVTAEAVPKLLDFGIAKIVDEDGGTPAYEPTLTGFRILTPGYASPEHIRGQTITPRSDVYSLGVVLYELLSGRSPYRLTVRTQDELSRAACEYEPERLSLAVRRLESGGSKRSAMPADAVAVARQTTPERLSRQLRGDLDNILSQALRKEPAGRYNSAEELARDIDRHMQHLPVKARPSTLTYRASKFFQRHRSEVGAALVAATWLTVWGLTRSATFRVSNLVKITDFGRAEAFDGLATDGKRLYFEERAGGHWELMQLSLGGGHPSEPEPIPTPFPSAVLFGIAPDHSALLVGSRNRNEEEVPLWAVPLPASAPRRLGDLIAHDAAWSADGKRLAYGHERELHLANGDGSQPRKLVVLSGRAWSPRWSPDGRIVRFTLEDSRSGGFSLWEIHSDGTSLHPLLAGWRPAGTAWGQGESAGVWTPDGRYYLYRHRSVSEGIWAIRERTFNPWPIKPNPVQLYDGPASLDFYTLSPSPDGKKLFLIAQDEHRELARYDLATRQFVPLPPNTPVQGLGPVSFSRDGLWLAYFAGGLLYRSRIDGRERRQLTSTPLFYPGNPRFSADGKRIAFQGGTEAGLPMRIFVIAAEGGQPEQLTSGPYADTEPEWASDGNAILVSQVDSAGGAAGHRYGCLLDLKSRVLSVLPGSEEAYSLRWSPDGRYIFAKTGSGLKLFDFRSRQWRRLRAQRTVDYPFWSVDSKYVYGQDAFGGAGQPIIRIRVSDGAIETVANPSLSLPRDVAGWLLVGLMPDGSPLAAVLRKNSDVYGLTLNLP